jgi:hypothetical protein
MNVFNFVFFFILKVIYKCGKIYHISRATQIFSTLINIKNCKFQSNTLTVNLILYIFFFLENIHL